MIFDKLCRLDRYRGLFPALDRGIDFLQNADLSALPFGRVEIMGETVYGNHFSYTTGSFPQDALFEAHQRHLDLHIVLSGRESVALAPVENLKQVELLADEDAVMYLGEPAHTLVLESGYFLLVFPEEGHLPKLAAGLSEDVDKLVVKISI